MERSPTYHRIFKRSDSVHKQLNMYALAAGAAGVSLMALAELAEAKIVYTPAHIRVPSSGFVDLDLNHDGTKDFRIFETSGFPAAVLKAQLLQTNKVWGVRSGTMWMAGALKAGMRVGKNSAFRNYSSGLYMAIVTTGNSNGPWIGKTQALSRSKVQHPRTNPLWMGTSQGRHSEERFPYD